MSGFGSRVIHPLSLGFPVPILSTYYCGYGPASFKLLWNQVIEKCLVSTKRSLRPGGSERSTFWILPCFLLSQFLSPLTCDRPRVSPAQDQRRVPTLLMGKPDSGCPPAPRQQGAPARSQSLKGEAAVPLKDPRPPAVPLKDLGERGLGPRRWGAGAAECLPTAALGGERAVPPAGHRPQRA